MNKLYFEDKEYDIEALAQEAENIMIDRETQEFELTWLDNFEILHWVINIEYEVLIDDLYDEEFAERLFYELEKTIDFDKVEREIVKQKSARLKTALTEQEFSEIVDLVTDYFVSPFVKASPSEIVFDSIGFGYNFSIYRSGHDYVLINVDDDDIGHDFVEYYDNFGQLFERLENIMIDISNDRD